MCLILMLLKKEKTIINQLMSIECISNILYSFLASFTQSPYFKGTSQNLYCSPHLVLVTIFAVYCFIQVKHASCIHVDQLFKVPFFFPSKIKMIFTV